MEKLKAPLGTRDILPEAAAAWHRVEATAREVFERWGYGEIRTPIFEDPRLFVRGIGETTDIVEKEMYTLETAGGTRLTLRPESTAPVVRAYIEHGFPKSGPFQKFYYIGWQFRHERPQANRYRQFGQIGIEALGSKDPRLDAETISLAAAFFEAVGLGGLHLRVNSLGDAECRPRMRERLEEALAPRLGDLCEECRKRYERNVFRIVDCKKEACREVVASLPDLGDLLCEACRSHFDVVLGELEALGIPYERDPGIVRGLDYYARTIWEMDDPGLGAQSAVGGGGRYDPLLVELGGPDVGGIGFALGTDRIINALAQRGGEGAPAAAGLDLVVVPVDDDARPAAFRMLERLRRAGVRADTDYEGRSLKAQMKRAGRLGVGWVAILGPDEIARGAVRLRDMRTKSEVECPESEIQGRMTAEGPPSGGDAVPTS